MTEALPGVLADIAAVAGREAALSVALAFGGQTFYLPTSEWLAAHPGREHPLREHLGAALAGVAGRIGGETIYIPMATRACVVHLSAKGVDTSIIARRLRISEKTARRYARV